MNNSTSKLLHPRIVPILEELNKDVEGQAVMWADLLTPLQFQLRDPLVAELTTSVKVAFPELKEDDIAAIISMAMTVGWIVGGKLG
jgi:hypothetical protein